MALFLKRAGLEMTSVSYRGTAPAMTDVMAGHIPTMFVPLPEAMPQAEGGNIRMLAVSGDERARRAPDIADHRGIRLSRLPRQSWNGLMAPAGHARRHRQPDRGRVRQRRQGSEIRRAARHRKASSRSGFTPAEFAKFIAAGHGALGGGGEDRRRHAAVAAKGRCRALCLAGTPAADIEIRIEVQLLSGAPMFDFTRF